MDVVLFFHVGDDGRVKGGALPLPGSAQLFLGAVAFPQEIAVGFQESRGEVAVFVLGPVADGVHGIPFGGAACRQEVADDPVGEGQPVDGVAELFQGFSGSGLPLVGGEGVHAGDFVFVHLGGENGGLVASVLVGDQLIRVLFHPVHGRVEAYAHDNVGIGHLGQQDFRIFHKGLQAAGLMAGDAVFVRVVFTRAEPVGVGHEEEDP